MDFKVLIITACLACLVPHALGTTFITNSALSAVDAGTKILGAGVQAKGTLIKALLGAKAGLIGSLITHKPSSPEHNKPCSASHLKPSICGKVSGLFSLIQKAAQFKSQAVGSVLRSLQPSTTAKPPSVVYRIVTAPKLYPVPLIKMIE